MQFKKEKKLIYRDLHAFLNTGGISASLRTVMSWCMKNKKVRRGYPRKSIPRLAELTEIPIQQFWVDDFDSEVGSTDSEVPPA